NSDRCLTLCAVAARLAGRRSAEEIGLQSPCRRDAAIAPPGRLSPDKYRFLLLAPRCDLRPLVVDVKASAPFPARVCCFPQQNLPPCGSTAELFGPPRRVDRDTALRRSRPNWMTSASWPFNRSVARGECLIVSRRTFSGGFLDQRMISFALWQTT